jgi:DNA-binding response OmpR family regulator
MDGSRRPHVLLADSAPKIRDLFGRFLTLSGMVVTCAADGVGGLAEARARVPDAVVCDLITEEDGRVAMARYQGHRPARSNV